MCACNEPQENKNTVNVLEDFNNIDDNIKIIDNNPNENHQEDIQKDQKFVIAKLGDNNPSVNKQNDQSQILTGGGKKRIDTQEQKTKEEKLTKKIDHTVNSNNKIQIKPCNSNKKKLEPEKNEKEIVFTEETFKLQPNKKIKNGQGDNEISIVITGTTESGKTSFFYKITKGKFESMYIPSISNEVGTKVIKFNGKDYKLKFIDTPGSSDYQRNMNNLLDECNFIFLFFDPSKTNTLDKTKKILFEKIGKYGKLYNNKIPNIYFICNIPESFKKDSNGDVQKFCDKMGIKFFEVCVKNSYKIKNLLEDVIQGYEKACEN